MTLKDRIATSRGLRPEQVEEQLLAECLPWFWRGMARLSGNLKDPTSLKPDRGLVRLCLTAKSAQEVLAEVEMFHYRELHFVPTWRRLLGFRVSGQRLLDIAGSTFRR